MPTCRRSLVSDFDFLRDCLFFSCGEGASYEFLKKNKAINFLESMNVCIV